MARLAPEHFAAVRDVVAEVERKTRGEVVPLVVRDAGEYGWVRDRGAVAGFAIAVLAAEAFGWLRAWPLDAREIGAVGIAGFLLGAAIGSIPAVARKVVGRARIARTVHRRALAEFTARGCGNTRDRTGILVMVALFEHRIEIVADRGIQSAAVAAEGPEVWSRITSEYANAAKAGRAVDGLVETIRSLGEILARHFPPSDAGNELPDRLQTEE